MYRYPCKKAIRKIQEMIYTKFKIMSWEGSTGSAEVPHVLFLHWIVGIGVFICLFSKVYICVT